MGFRYFNLRDARVSLNSAQARNFKSINRRKFFKTIGVGSIALSPAIGTIKKTMAASFDLHATEEGFWVSRHGSKVWQFPSAVFAKGSSSFVKEVNNSYFIELKKVRLVGSQNDFTILCKIFHNDIQWRLAIEIPDFNYSTEIDFLQFLDKNEILLSQANLNYQCGSQSCSGNVSLQGLVEMGIDSHWNFAIKGDNSVVLNFNGKAYASDVLFISSNNNRTKKRLVTAPAKALSLNFADFKSWPNLIRGFSFNKGYSLEAFGPLPELNMVLWDDKTNHPHSLLVVNNTDGGLQFGNSHFDNFTFKHHRYIFFSEMVNSSLPDSYLAAAIHQQGQWYTNPLGSFQMGAVSETPDFEAIAKGDEMIGYRFAPAVSSFKPAISNAISLPAALPVPLHMKVVSENENAGLVAIALSAIPDTIVKRKLNVNPAIVKPLEEPNTKPQRAIKIEPQKTEPSKPKPQEAEPPRQQVKPDKTIVPEQPVKREQPKQPVLEVDPNKFVLKPVNLTFRLLRPDDMLLLDFEFQNFAFENKGTETYMRLADKQKKGLVTIWFQTQHTLEEAFFEETNIPESDKTKSKVESISLPIRHLRARRSRLVFEYKAESPGFKMDEEGLLDWSKYDLRTHPRAWIKLSNAIIISKAGRERIELNTISKRNDISLQKSEKQYNVKLISKSKKVSDRLQIYDESKLSQVIDADLVASMKPDYSFNTLGALLNKVEEIPLDSTSIEAPALMYISPNQLGGFIHKVHAEKSKIYEKEGAINNIRMVSGTGKGEITELWHTKLGVKLKDGQVSDDIPALTTIRALWAHDANTDYTNLPPREAPFIASLDANNRHKLVHTTSNYNLTDSNQKSVSPIPVPINRLMLSSLGAFLDWHAFFKLPAGISDYLNIIEWQHYATLGRDHFVKVVEEGYLLPFGHRAAIVKITERKFNGSKKAALNMQRMFVMVLEKEVMYDGKGPDNKFIEFPFQSVVIETTVTPNIDNPSEKTLATFSPLPPKPDKGIKNQSQKLNTAYNFLISVGAKPFDFDITTTDKDGKNQKIRMPLVFVENFIARNQDNVKKIIPTYNAANYPNLINFFGQKLGYAESLLEDDTSFETLEVQFGARDFKSTGAGAICFHPFMQKSVIYIEQVNQLTGKKEPVTIKLVDDKNKGQVFAAVIDGGLVDFSGGSDKSGGFLSPSMGITALSRLQGPVSGNIEDISNMVFKAADFFKDLGNIKIPQIFGIIDLFALFSDTGSDFGNSMKAFADNVNAIRDKIEGYKREIEALKYKLLQSAEEAKQDIQSQLEKIKNNLKKEAENMLQQLNNSISKIPSFKTYVTLDAFHVEYKWQPELKGNHIEIFPGILSLNIDGDPSKSLSINTHFKKSFDLTTAPVLTSEARFDKFKVVIADMLAVNFNYLKFSGGSNGKGSVNVDLGPGMPLEFVGSLDFVSKLQEIIPKTGFSEDGPYIELTTAGIKAGFTISVPNIEVGICMISNISLGAYVNLPFTKDPMTVGFNFCTKENPFMLTISCFGGGGYFQLVTRLNGLQSVEAALEFGAAISLNVGVASGGVSVMGGIYYKTESVIKELDNKKSIEVQEAKLSAYLRINGHLSILGLIHVSLEFYLTLDAIIENGKVQKLEGSATLKVKIEILFFSKTVSVTVRRTLAGSGGDPKFVEMIDENDWQQYCLAFAN